MLSGVMMNWRTAAAILSLGLLVIYGILLFQMRRQLAEGYSDFIILYTAGKILQRGAPSQLYDLQLQYQIQREVAPNVQIRHAALPFVRPAFEAWIFWPLAHLSYAAAFVLWNVLSCACLVAAVLLLRQEISELRSLSPLLMIAGSLSYFPVFLTLLQGQDSIVVLLIYVLSYRALRRNRQFVGGMTLGLGMFKFPLVIPFLIPFFSRRRFPVVLGFVLTSLLLAAISIWTVGWSAAAYYPRYLRGVNQLARGINRPPDMPNLRGLLSTVLPTVSPITGVLLLSILSILLLAFVLRKWWLTPSESGASLALGIALNVVSTVLVSYHCHAFDWTVLLLPIAIVLGFVLSGEPIPSQSQKLLVWTLCALLFSPLYLLIMFTANTPSLLAVVLIAFALAIGVAMSEMQRLSAPDGR
jgi:hypothetical protein